MHPLAAASGSNPALTVLGIVLIVLGIVAYWTPTIIAIFRWKDIPNGGGVIVLNFFGFTVVCWIIALVMAVKSRPRPVGFAPGPYGFPLPPQQPQTFPQPTAPQPQQWQDPRQP
jgi:hypothetical protein